VIKGYESFGGPGRSLSRFAVQGIPGAHGFATSVTHGLAYHVVFADGTFTYEVGASSPSAMAPPTSREVIAAALRLYRRVHGHPAQ
jgi:hypothetical protein